MTEYDCMEVWSGRMWLLLYNVLSDGCTWRWERGKDGSFQGNVTFYRFKLPKEDVGKRLTPDVSVSFCISLSLSLFVCTYVCILFFECVSGGEEDQLILGGHCGRCERQRGGAKSLNGHAVHHVLYICGTKVESTPLQQSTVSGRNIQRSLSLMPDGSDGLK